MHSLSLLTLSNTIVTAFSADISRPGWTERTPIGRGPRQEESVTALGSDVYIVGGITGPPYPTVNWVEVFCTTTSQWRNASSLPTPSNHGNIATVNGQIYILGGLNGTQIWSAIPNSYAYTPSIDTWTPLPPMPNNTAGGASAIGVYNSAIYITGSLTELNLVTEAQPTVATVLFYNIQTQQWHALPSLPEGRDHVGGAVINHTFYVVGGRLNGRPNVRNTVFPLDLLAANKTWVEKARMPTARGGLAAASIGNKIYTFGGEGDPDLVPNGVFDTAEDRWDMLSPMPYPRHGTNAAAVRGRIHIPGGGNLTCAGPQNRIDFFRPGGKHYQTG